jgi:hypothetical protein
MNLHEAFKHQVDNTRLLEKEDIKPTDGPLVWNGVIFRLPNGCIYSSGKEMQAGDKFIIGYETSVHNVPRPLLIEEKELEDYDQKYYVARVIDNIPIMERK